jgi:ABC-type lipoprotein export system ATPase subunit
MALIDFHNVRKSYRMGGNTVHALDGVDLEIRDGDFAAVLGPSGSGKSTLMHLLGFLDQPTSGTIRFDGQDVSKISPRARATLRARRIGFVFQAFNLLPRLSVAQNVLLPLSYARGATYSTPTHERLHAVLEAVGMNDRAHHRPAELSGGQRQRVAIARALINEPKLILADEPTGNLDTARAASIMDLFAELNRQGRTVVVVTHDTEIAARCRRSIKVRDGKILPDAPPPLPVIPLLSTSNRQPTTSI